MLSEILDRLARKLKKHKYIDNALFYLLTIGFVGGFALLANKYLFERFLNTITKALTFVWIVIGIIYAALITIWIVNKKRGGLKKTI